MEAMLPYMTEKFGNPSSIYSYGRETKLAIETARKTVARLLGAAPGEIFFTSGGTESTNTAVAGAIRDLGCKRIISSPIEHHATLHTVEYWSSYLGLELSFVELDEKGHVDMQSLEALLDGSPEKCLVSLMHANNEIGTMLDIKAVGELCERYGAIFHCDTVQTVGHFPLDLNDVKAHFITGAGHKFHGPKGIGILYVREGHAIKPMINGGGQERNMRAGTENLYGIVGFAKALELAMDRYEADSAYIAGIKRYMMERLTERIPQCRVNGDPEGRCLYTVLNVSFPKTEKSEMILFNLDIAGICVSGGSACSSGAHAGSHVIHALEKGNDSPYVAVRFSFSKHNTREEVDKVIDRLIESL